MTRQAFGAGALALVILAVPAVSAQAPQGRAGGAAQGRGGRGAAPALPEPTNLQILPKDMTRQQVVPIMQGFNAALGVACNYCHVTAQDAAAGRGRAAGPAPA
ncbi:MAG: hypothetical protein FJW14_18560, partial [Acidimicrobiia bacterium]|nr:hypothetical protein [Acidimicrobiia bacterium]